MANSEWVKYTEWFGGAMTDYGAIRLDNLDRYLNGAKTVAEEMLQESDAKHIVYAVKKFENGELFEVEFWKEPVSDWELEAFSRLENKEFLAVSKMESGDE